jgi:hypothetical protein
VAGCGEGVGCGGVEAGVADCGDGAAGCEEGVDGCGGAELGVADCGGGTAGCGEGVEVNESMSGGVGVGGRFGGALKSELGEGGESVGGDGRGEGTAR